MRFNIIQGSKVVYTNDIGEGLSVKEFQKIASSYVGKRIVSFKVSFKSDCKVGDVVNSFINDTDLPIHQLESISIKTN